MPEKRDTSCPGTTFAAVEIANGPVLLTDRGQTIRPYTIRPYTIRPYTIRLYMIRTVRLTISDSL